MEKQKKRFVKIIILSTIIVVLALSCVFNSKISSLLTTGLYKGLDVRTNSDDLVVHYITIGQGDAVAIQFPNRQTMLIDTGPKSGQNNLISYINGNVIKDNMLPTIDYVLLSHPDIDHAGGMCAVFGGFNVKCFFRPNVASLSEDESGFALKSESDEYDEVIKAAKCEDGIKIEKVVEYFQFYVGKVKVEIFPPVGVYDTTNEMSQVVKISYLGKSFLFTGDIGFAAESDMIAKYSNKLDADVLKVAHHGSKNSTSEQFVDMVSPEYAVICTHKNLYGHPALRVIATLEDSGAKICRTDLMHIRFVCSKDYFGLLKQDTIKSYVSMQWWKIALAIDIVLIIVLLKDLVKMFRNKSDFI